MAICKAPPLIWAKMRRYRISIVWGLKNVKLFHFFILSDVKINKNLIFYMFSLIFFFYIIIFVLINFDLTFFVKTSFEL